MPTKPLRDRLKAAAREEILAAAEQVLADRGIATARVEEIAERSGVSVGTIYNYFGDRQGLVQALLEAEKGQLLDKWDRELAASKGRPFAVRLETLLDVTFAHFDEHRRLFTLLSDDELCGQRLIRRHRSALKELRARVEQLTGQAVKEGDLRPEHRELYPFVIAGTLKSLFAHQVDGEGVALSGRGKSLVDLFLEGARRRA